MPQADLRHRFKWSVFSQDPQRWMLDFNLGRNQCSGVAPEHPEVFEFVKGIGAVAAAKHEALCFLQASTVNRPGRQGCIFIKG